MIEIGGWYRYVGDAHPWAHGLEAGVLDVVGDDVEVLIIVDAPGRLAVRVVVVAPPDLEPLPCPHGPSTSPET